MPGYARDVSRGAFIDLDNGFFCVYNIYQDSDYGEDAIGAGPIYQSLSL